MDQPSGIQIDPGRAEPLYKQIYSEIVSRIRTGVYPVGHRLPPTRELARELSTHRNTVARAFEELESSGLVHSVVGRGTFIAEQPKTARPAAAPQPHELPWNSLLSHAANAQPLSQLDRLVLRVQGQDLINLASLSPSPDLLPADLLRRCLDHVLRTQGSDVLGYAPHQGVPRLRELIADLLGQARIPAIADDVIITTGSQQAIDLITRALVNPGDTLLVDEYTYPGALTALAAAGADLVAVPGDADGPDLSALCRLTRNGAKGFYLMPNCANPTGRCMTIARRKQLVDWSHEASVPLIEDDYAADLELDGSPTPVALRTLDAEVLYVGTFSKRLIPALRIGFLLCPRSLRRQFVALKHSLDLGTSELLQHALAEFIERGYLRSHLRHILPEFRLRRDALETALREHLPAEVSWRHARHGVFLWLSLPPYGDAELVFEEAQRHGVLVSPGTLHSVHQPASCGVRLAFCAEPPERLAEGARRLGAALRAIVARHGQETAPSTPVMEGV